MSEEMKFLKYRRDVVTAWPESPRKRVFLTSIESRMNAIQSSMNLIERQMQAPAGVRMAHAA